MSDAAARSRRRAERLTRNFTQAEWQDLLLRAEFRCSYCGVPLSEKEATVEHQTPMARGGSNHIRNIAVACASCGRAKGMRTAEEFVGRERARLIRRKLHRKEPLAATILRRALHRLAVAYLGGERGSGEALLALVKASGLPAEDAVRAIDMAQRARSS